jgi:hypothetical protein
MMHDGYMQEWFVCEDGTPEDRVAYAQEETCKDRVKDMYHEAPHPVRHHLLQRRRPWPVGDKKLG